MGLGDVLSGVNLRDFAQMVRGEYVLVSSSMSEALRSTSRLRLLALPVAALRFLLLGLVVVVFVPLIVAVSVARWAAKIWRTRSERVSP
jgi:hypothetical protein